MEKKNSFAKFWQTEYAVVVVFIFLSIIVAISTPSFLQMSNILSVVKRTATTGIIAIGMSFVIATGGIDLSVGGVLCFSSMIGAYLLAGGFPTIPTIIIVCIVGLGLGLVNGLLVTIFNFQPFMVTLSMLQITSGLVMYITKARTIFGFKDQGFAIIGQGTVLNIPTAIYLFAIVAVIAVFIVKRHTYGRCIMAVGSNARGAWYAGINVKMVRASAYAVCGLCCGISAVITLSRLMAANSTLGDGIEMDAIAAVVIGGQSLAGGSLYVVGAVIGSLLIELISNFMNLQGVDSYMRTAIKGLIILFALILDAARKGDLTKIANSDHF